MKNKLSSLIIKVLTKVNYIIFGKPRFKQELLIRKALVEKGFKLRRLKIICDHNLGINYVNGIKLGIKYPDSFYNEATKLIPANKSLNYYFNGNTAESGKRSILLEPFINLNKSKIISSNEGRVQKNKNKFNYNYFQTFAKAKFGLCPHQADWEGEIDYMWTYRFIESCFIEAIPILFEGAPLGKMFIDGFNYYWDYEALNDSFNPNNPTYDIEIAKSNRFLAERIFCLTEEECKLINTTLRNS